MNDQKKGRVLAAGAALGLVAVLASCGGGDDGNMATTPSAAAGDHEVDSHDSRSGVPEDARHIEVAARSFEFEPAVITVTEGEPIAIVLTAADAEHDFVIDEVDAHVSAAEGETQFGGFTAGEPGEYVFYCSVAGHRDAGMEGTLTVEAAP